MPLYLIERNFAEQLQLTHEAMEGAVQVIAAEGNTWLFSFLSADKKKMYCLYESPAPDAIRAAAQRLGLPADVIMPVEEIRPDGFRH
ncbi:MAG: DUF4242 domain-containing protein [Pseudonocardiaceae bacterium]